MRWRNEDDGYWRRSDGVTLKDKGDGQWRCIYSHVFYDGPSDYDQQHGDKAWMDAMRDIVWPRDQSEINPGGKPCTEEK